MGKLDQRLREESPARKLKKALIDLIFFPRLVSKKYARYNIGLREMIASFGDKTAETVWTQNVKRVNFFIRLPIAIGFLSGALLWYANAKEIKNQWKQTKNPVTISLIKNKRTPAKWVQFYPEKVKVNLIYFSPFFVGYIFSMAGSVFLSLNPAFKAEKTIKQALITQKYLLDSGEPWDVVWTPYGILFYVYNCDPNVLQKNVRFWNSINFKPDDPKVSPKDANVVLIKKAYDLPDSIMLNVMPLIKNKQKPAEETVEEVVRSAADLGEPEEEEAQEEVPKESQEESDNSSPQQEEEIKPESEPQKETDSGIENVSRDELRAIAKAVKNANVVFKKRKEYPYTPKAVPTLSAADIERLKEKGVLPKNRSGF